MGPRLASDPFVAIVNKGFFAADDMPTVKFFHDQTFKIPWACVSHNLLGKSAKWCHAGM
jgi:hypothetical protein